jgi:hypothetical protein
MEMAFSAKPSVFLASLRVVRLGWGRLRFDTREGCSTTVTGEGDYCRGRGFGVRFMISWYVSQSGTCG